MLTANNPGYQTSEFWLSLISTVLGVLLAMHVIPAQLATVLNQEAATIVGGVLALVSVVSYIAGRVVLKHTAIINGAALSPTTSQAAQPPLFISRDDATVASRAGEAITLAKPPELPTDSEHTQTQPSPEAIPATTPVS